MNKTLLAVPCMNIVDTEFMACFIDARDSLLKKEKVGYSLIRSSLVYDARNLLAKEALEKDYDRILFIDSDMVFDNDAFVRLSDTMDEGYDYVTGLFFYKTLPTKPAMYRGVYYDDSKEKIEAKLTTYFNYPRDSVFEIAGSGCAFTMISTDAIGKVVASGERFPFSPVLGLGEDVSFCMRLHNAGVKMYCDSRVKIGHIGKFDVGEKQYIAQVEAGVKPHGD